jgi:hypothetical protein
LLVGLDCSPAAVDGLGFATAVVVAAAVDNQGSTLTVAPGSAATEVLGSEGGGGRLRSDDRGMDSMAGIASLRGIPFAPQAWFQFDSFDDPRPVHAKCVRRNIFILPLPDLEL